METGKQSKIRDNAHEKVATPRKGFRILKQGRHRIDGDQMLK